MKLDTLSLTEVQCSLLDIRTGRQVTRPIRQTGQMDLSVGRLVIMQADIRCVPEVRITITVLCDIKQCLSTAGPRPGTGPWHQLYRSSRGSPGICHFSFLNNFHFYSGNVLRRKIFVNVLKNSDQDVGLRKLQYATRFH